jgi:hypothetical protein
MPAIYDSAAQLADALRRAEEAHGRYEKGLGHADPDWPSWYAQHMLDEQSASSGQSGPAASA